MSAPPPARLTVTRAAAVWLAVAVVLSLVGWYKTINLLVLSGYLLAALLLVNVALAWRSLRRVRVTVAPPTPTYPHEWVNVTGEVANLAAGPATALVTASGGVNRSSWLVTGLPGGASKPLVATWTFPERGMVELPPWWVDSSYPLGLIHLRRPAGAATRIAVLPAVGPVDLPAFRRWLIRAGAGDGQPRRAVRQSTPQTGDLKGLRPYRRGDNPRDIHWKTSARRDQLLVREYDHAEPLGVTLVIDPHLPGVGGEANAALEWCLSLATSLAVALADADNPADLGLVVPGVGVERGRASPAFVRRAFAALAGVAGSAEVPAVPAAWLAGRSSRLLVSPREGGPVAQALRKSGAFREVTPRSGVAWFRPPLTPG